MAQRSNIVGAMDPNSELMARLDAVEQRLGTHARAAEPSGRTEPDEGGMERWEAGQVWAHIGEFVPYWNEQLRMVVSKYDGTPVPFGRSRTDPGRLKPIEENRNVPIAEQMAGTHSSLVALEAYVRGMSPSDWSAVGMHPARGAMDARQIVQFFVVDHLEEHADQLDGLA